MYLHKIPLKYNNGFLFQLPVICRKTQFYHFSFSLICFNKDKWNSCLVKILAHRHLDGVTKISACLGSRRIFFIDMKLFYPAGSYIVPSELNPSEQRCQDCWTKHPMHCWYLGIEVSLLGKECSLTNNNRIWTSS